MNPQGAGQGNATITYDNDNHLCSSIVGFLRGILPYQRLTSDEIANLSTITTCYLNIQMGPFDDDQDAQAFVSGSGDGSVVRAPGS